MGVDVVEFGRFDQGVGDGGGPAACFRTDEEVVLAAEGDGAHAAFSRIVIQLKDAVVEIGTQAFHSGQGVSDGGGQWRFARDCGELHCQPSFQIVEDWGGMGAAEFCAAIRWGAASFLLDGIKLCDPADGLFGDQGAL